MNTQSSLSNTYYESSKPVQINNSYQYSGHSNNYNPTPNTPNNSYYSPSPSTHISNSPILKSVVYSNSPPTPTNNSSYQQYNSPQMYPQQQYQQQQQQQQIMQSSFNSLMLDGQISTYKITRPYYQLEIFVSSLSSSIPENGDKNIDLKSLYRKIINEHNSSVLPVITSQQGGEFNAGFDLIVPNNMVAYANSTTKIDHNIKCRMTEIVPHYSHPFNVYMDNNGILRQYYTTNIPVCYYLYPRSSTGSKTPLRLSNSVGIIDSGYRGNIIAMFDNIRNQDFHIQETMRLVQLCPSNISYPIYVILVDNEQQLGKTKRDTGGFGSTGSTL